ncbi:MAG: hypothetical protein GEU93_08765 [Propionibacteriales bacterium]|nr:hypothetical protein [Propionibacteriales bacterium]
MMSHPEGPTPHEPPARRVFVHIGAPKTGTTFVQQVMWANREHLAEDGILYPYTKRGEHLRATLDLRERGWGDSSRRDFAGAWDTIAERARDWPGHTVILGHEIMGGATEPQIRRLVRSLEPAQVHVIFTARDIARQLTSDWQEHLKHRHTVTLEQFVGDLVELGHDAPKPFGEMFWGLHDAPFILRRWATVVPAERIHIVTVPQPGASGDTLWQRFCTVTGLDADRYDTDVQRTNRGLGIVEAELLRRVNRRLAQRRPRIPAMEYDQLVRLHLANRALAERSDRIVLPPDSMPWALDKSREMVTELRKGGYDVCGDLEELIPRPEDHENFTARTDLTGDRLLPSAVLTIAALLRIAARQKRQLRELRARLGELPPTAASFPSGSPGSGSTASGSLRGRLRAGGRRARSRLRRARAH